MSIRPSTVGNYKKHSDVKEDQEPDSQGEYVEKVDKKPTDLKPSVQETEAVGSSESCTSELFQEINELTNLSCYPPREEHIF